MFLSSQQVCEIVEAEREGLAQGHYGEEDITPLPWRSTDGLIIFDFVRWGRGREGSCAILCAWEVEGSGGWGEGKSKGSRRNRKGVEEEWRRPGSHLQEKQTIPGGWPMGLIQMTIRGGTHSSTSLGKSQEGEGKVGRYKRGSLRGVWKLGHGS